VTAASITGLKFLLGSRCIAPAMNNYQGHTRRFIADKPPSSTLYRLGFAIPIYNHSEIIILIIGSNEPILLWEGIMSQFASRPPSNKAEPLGAMFRGGMMPATGGSTAAFIVFDLRSLRIPIADGQAIEKVLRDVLFQELTNRGVQLTNRSATDLSNAVFGIGID
jgi:hypothetical protein